MKKILNRKVMTYALLGLSATGTITYSDSNNQGAWRPDSIVKPVPNTEDNKPLDKAAYISVFSVLPGLKDGPGRLGVTAAVSDDVRPDLEDYRSTFAFSDVEASPGYFSVPLSDNQVKVDFTATRHVVVYRFTFPASEKGCHVVMDISHPLGQFQGGEVKLRDSKTVEGFGTYRDEKGGDGKVYFSFQFTEPIRKRGGWENKSVTNNHIARSQDGSALGFFAYFWDTYDGETLLMKVGISNKSIDDARANLVNEFPGWDFRQLCRQGKNAWEPGIRN